MPGLLFSASLLCWQLIGYGPGADIAYHGAPMDAAPPNPFVQRFRTRIGSRQRWAGTSALALFWSLILLWETGWSRTGLALAAIVVAGALLLPAVRRLWIPKRFLAEWEVSASAAMTFCLWQLGGATAALSSSVGTISVWSVNREIAGALLAALLIFAVRAGSLIVVGILEKSGGIPGQETPAPAQRYPHTPGEMIGYIERATVFIFVVSGNFQALAFFFVAKGLARSKKLDEDLSWANYFVLGSLASFFVALVCGLLGQQVLALYGK